MLRLEPIDGFPHEILPLIAMELLTQPATDRCLMQRHLERSELFSRASIKIDRSWPVPFQISKAAAEHEGQS